MKNSESLPLGSLLLTVFTSILEVFLLCLAGYILASRGILDKKTQKQLNRLNVSLFTPALLFSKVAFFLSPEKLRELWIIPLFFVIVTAVSMAVSFLLGSIFGLKKSQRHATAFAMAAAMFMNSNSLPIALMQSLVVTVHGLKWVLLLRWSYGVRLLSQADDEGAIRLPDDSNDPLLSSSSQETLSDRLYEHAATDSEYSATAPTIPSIIVDDTHTRPQPARKQSKFYNSFPNSPNQSRVELPFIESVAPSAFNSDDETSDDETGTVTANASTLPVHQQRQHSHAQSSSSTSSVRIFFRRCKRRIHRTCVAFNEFMTVPLWAALLSIIVALIQPVQHALEMHMQPVKGALTSAGNCSIPVTLIVLGAYFYPNKDENATISTNGHQINGHTTTSMLESSSSSTLLQSVREMFHGKTKRRHDKSSRPGETKTVIIAVASRMILTPLLLLPLMVLFTKFDLQRVFDDPVFVVSNVLLISSPPALTLAQITQAASGDAFERLISRTIFWSYCIITPPATIIYVVIGLILAKL
uniref:Endoplasmic reticulum auxin efflux carrier n=1 Tax=Moniliophthora roreri TaxID=221103 RepID=A0A0W0GCJ6_MONRR